MALTACMRPLFTILNAMIRSNSHWHMLLGVRASACAIQLLTPASREAASV
jgi:hypothetical protein